jgi:competence protein ComEC
MKILPPYLLLTAVLVFKLSAHGAAAPQMYAHCIDVGQADATLLEFPCGALLIDAGAQDDEAANRLLQYLGAFFQRRPDLNKSFAGIYITHPHKDHTFALKRVLQNFRTKNFMENGQDYGSGIANVRWVRSVADQNQIKVRKILNSEVMKNGNQSGLTDAWIDSVKCDNCDPEVVILSGQWDRDTGWPAQEYKNNNNHSLVIRVEFGQSSFLFSGDLEEDGIHEVLAHYQASADASGILDADVYHVGHHGSHNATTVDWLQAITPSIAIISMGHWDDGKASGNPFSTWAYGHPRRTTVDLLSRHITGRRSESVQVNLGTGAKRFFPSVVRRRIYATGWDGNTVIRASLNHEFTVSRNK